MSPLHLGRPTFGQFEGIHQQSFTLTLSCMGVRTQITLSLGTGSGQSSLMTNRVEILLRMSDLNRCFFT
jgi:hypothetical protein